MSDQLSEYLLVVQQMVSPEYFESLVSIEMSFKELNYTEHLDDIQRAILTENDDSIEDVVNEVKYIYRLASQITLETMGVRLIDFQQIPIHILALILAGTIELGTDVENLESINDTEESDLLYYAQAISLVTDFTADDVLQYIDSVSTYTVDKIREGSDTIPPLEPDTFDALPRFKALLLENRTSLVYQHVINSNAAGYDLPSVRTILADDIAMLEEDNSALFETKLLVLASNTPDNLVDFEIEYSIQYIFDEPRASNIIKLLEGTNE